MATFKAGTVPQFNNNFRYDARNNRFMQNADGGGFNALKSNDLWNNDAVDWNGWQFEGQGDGKKSLGLGGSFLNAFGAGIDPGWSDAAKKSRNEYAQDWLWQNEANRMNAAGYGGDFDNIFHSDTGTDYSFGHSAWDQEEYNNLYSRGFNPFTEGTNWVDNFGLSLFTDSGITPDKGEVGYNEYQQLANNIDTTNPVINPSTGNPYAGAVWNADTGSWGMPANAMFDGNAIIAQQTPEEILADKDAAAKKEQADRDFMMQMIAAQNGGGEGGSSSFGVNEMMQLMQMLFSRYNNQGTQNQNYGYPGQSFSGSQWLIGPNGGYYDRPTAFNF